MDLSRRQFVQVGGAAAAAAAAPGLTGTDLAARPPLGWAARMAADMPKPDLPALLYNRAAFGPRPGDVERVRAMKQPYDWVEEQLDHTAIDDSAVDQALSRLPTLSMTPRQLLNYGMNRGQMVEELRLATIYRQVFSRRQLFEVMVDFWSDHLSIYHPTDFCEYFKTVDDRDVIRKHALGRFQDLLTASAKSPAMLNFLNNDASRVNNVNENYAREIMELHTLGVAVDGVPYTEQDVKEVAKCFTGWAWTFQETSPRRGEFEFRQDWHDNGSKEVLGQFIGPGYYLEDGQFVIDILCHHEATSRFLATKLVRRFVTDDPAGQTPELVARVAETYRRTDGDIKEMLHAILTSPEFASSFADFGGRLSRPNDLVARSLRAVDAQPESFPTDYRNNAVYNRLRYTLQSMGQLPFYWPTPDGYPDVKDAWGSSIGMLTRWNFGLALCGAGSGGAFGGELIPGFKPDRQTPADRTTAGAVVDFWVERLLHRPVLDADRALLVGYLTNGGNASTPRTAALDQRMPELIALILDSPYFQWR